MIDYVIKSAIVVGFEKIIFIDLDWLRKSIEEIADPELSLELSERRYCAWMTGQIRHHHSVLEGHQVQDWHTETGSHKANKADVFNARLPTSAYVCVKDRWVSLVQE